MRRGRRGSLLSGVLIVCLVTSLFVPTVVADSHDGSDGESDRVYQIVHGVDEAQVISVDPVAGDEPVEEFYDARNPDGQSLSSMGTTAYQQDDESILMLYEGPHGVSLVAVHDKYYEGRTAGTPGGSVSWNVSGLPENGEWAVIDDDADQRSGEDTNDDRFYIDANHRSGVSGTDGEPPGEADALLSWVWQTGETDGVAYRGLDQDVSITVSARFNEESYQRREATLLDRPSRVGGYNGTVDDWVAIIPSGDGTAFETTDFHHTHEPTRIRSTSEPTRLRETTLETDRIEPGESARVTAVIENPGDTNWTHEASLRIGDSEIQTQTVTVPAGAERTVEFTQQFTQTGVYEIGVDDERTTLTVGTPNSTDETNDENSAETTEEQTPGFGPAVAVIALCVVVLGARHRTNS